MTLAEQLVVLHNGRIQQMGTPNTVYHLPANQMVAGFLGSPPMNFLPAKSVEGYFHCGEQQLPIPEVMAKSISSYSQEILSLGIRPEAITVGDPSAPSPSADLKIQIQLIEPLGRETLLRGQVLGTDESLNFLVPGIWQGQRQEYLKVTVDLNQVFVFRESDGARLYPNN